MFHAVKQFLDPIISPNVHHCHCQIIVFRRLVKRQGYTANLNLSLCLTYGTRRLDAQIYTKLWALSQWGSVPVYWGSVPVFSELFLSKIYALFEVLENFPGNNLTGHIQRGHCNI